MDEYILEDHLKPDEARLVKEMLNAVVNYPDAINNRFTVKRVSLRAPIQGYSYFLSANGSALSPFRNNQILPEDISLVLLNLKLIEPERGHNKSGSWFSFTEAALEWHHQFGDPSADEIQKRIGRYLHHYVGIVPPFFVVDEIATEIKVPTLRVLRETRMLKGAGLIYSLLQNDTEFGALALSEPEGIRWAAAGFPSIGSLNAPITNVSLSLSVQVTSIIEQARNADISKEQLLLFEALMQRAASELDKPKGNGKFEAIKDLVAFAANIKELVPLAGSFVAENGDKIQGLSDAVGNIVPG